MFERIDEENVEKLNADIQQDLKDPPSVQVWDPTTFESAHKLIKTENQEDLQPAT